jgi:hypothetical protein
MQKEIIRIDPRGQIDLPAWAWKILLKQSKIRSKKWRTQKKAVKRQFTKLVLEEYQKERL